MGRRILHTGALGSASILKVVTNYLATANLVSVAEALATCRAAEIDLGTAYDAIAISSGTSFVHETEGQVILSGSRDISFTMELVARDIGLFQDVADRAGSAPGRGVIPTLARAEWSLARSSGEVRAGCWAAMDVLR